jgi:hypothetical protein
MMRKLFPIAAFILLFGTACEKAALSDVLQEDEVATAPTARKCDADVILQEQLANDPTFKANYEAQERFTQNFMEMRKRGMIQQATITIPVVVNVVYRTAAENVSDAQIQSQIDVLNKDFNAQNSDFNSYIPAEYANLKANVGVTFRLAVVNRKQTTKVSFRTNDDVKKTSKGGLDPTDPTTKLNIWVCTLSNSILGYAQFPGGPAATDGVVILNRGFGTTGTAAYPFNLGRTATHEVGHWMNLRHIWGDATCGNDQVADTPPHNTANYGCPAQGHLSTCTGSPKEMWMNYMDYTDDRCMYMFSNDQSSRMLATFASGGSRFAYNN